MSSANAHTETTQLISECPDFDAVPAGRATSVSASMRIFGDRLIRSPTRRSTNVMTRCRSGSNPPQTAEGPSGPGCFSVGFPVCMHRFPRFRAGSLRRPAEGGVMSTMSKKAVRNPKRVLLLLFFFVVVPVRVVRSLFLKTGPYHFCFKGFCFPRLWRH